MNNNNFIVKDFGRDSIEFVKDDDERIWITARAIAKGLDVHKDNVNQIFRNNRTLLNPYAGVMKIISPQGTRQNTRVFDKVGFIGICMRSNSPRALPFQQWTLKIIEEIERKGYYIARDRELGALLKKLLQELKKQKILLDYLKRMDDLEEERSENLKENKYDLILKHLDRYSWTTTKDLLRETNLTKSTLYAYLNRLETQNRIEVSTLKVSAPGRPTKRYKLPYVS